MLSYLLKYAVILIGICCHINRNMLSYLLEYDIIFIGMWYHIYWNIALLGMQLPDEDRNMMISRSSGRSGFIYMVNV